MTRLSYLLLFLWALGYGTNVTCDPTATATIATTVITTAQTTTTVNSVISTVSQTSPIGTTSTATTSAAITTPRAISRTVFPRTTKRTTIKGNDQQGTTQPTTVKPDTKPVGVTSTSKPSITATTPTVTSPNDNSAQPTDSPKVSTPDLNRSTLGVTSPPSTISNTKNLTTPLAATSPALLRTSQPSDVTNIRDKEVTMSMVSQSPVTISKTTRGNMLDSTTSLPEKTIPVTTTPPMISIQKTIENIEVNCTAEHGESFVTIRMKSSSICGDYASKEEDVKKILKHICTALKPGYQPDKDKCHVDLGSGLPGDLVIVDAYVQSSLTPNDLYAALKHIKAEDGSDLFTYNGKKYEEEDLVSIPLISAIVALAVALLIAAAIYGCWHQRQTRKREQRLTEELQTMENGYHDNPTLEVMETSPEMQEKKGGPNGELGDSWIVPLDNLTREDFDDEEDTHL